MTEDIVVFTGKPASGKSTIARALQDAIGKAQAHLLSSGNIAREQAGRNNLFADALTRGHMAPEGPMDAIMREVVRSWIHTFAAPPVLILDGYPRYLEQLTDLLHILHRSPVRIRLWAVDVEIPSSVALQRNEERGDKKVGGFNLRLDEWRRRTLPLNRYLIDREDSMKIWRCIDVNGEEEIKHNVATIIDHLRENTYAIRRA